MAEEQENGLKYEDLKNSAFRQNTLWAWRPKQSPYKTAIIFFIFGIAFLGIGIILLVVSREATERAIPYSGTGKYIHSIHLTLMEELQPPIYVYYEITKLHQNYRRFAYSKASDQLYGTYSDRRSDVATCYPVYTESDRLEDGKNNNKITNPCGLMPKYLFNDEVQIRNSEGVPVSISRNNIVFETERDKYKASPHNWTDIESESFLVWMKESPISPVRKLYGIINTPLKGDITIKIKNNYEEKLRKFKGERALVIATMTSFGGSQHFLGILYIVIAIILLLFSVIFFCIRRSDNSKREMEIASAESQQINASFILSHK